MRLVLATKVRDRKRIYTRLDDEEYRDLEYYARKHKQSVADYVHDAVLLAIAWEHRDFDIPVAEIHRLNQLVDSMTVLSSNVQSLEQVVTAGFDTLTGLTRGDNYLLDDETGEV